MTLLAPRLFTGVGPGTRHTCAVDDAGALVCFGHSADGRLGDGGSLPDTAVPNQVGSATDWVKIHAGDEFTCGIRDNAGARTLWCWGRNPDGRLGTGDLEWQIEPTQIDASTNWDSVALGSNGACGLRGTALYCWGSDKNQKLGDGNCGFSCSADSPTPLLIPGRLAGGHRRRHLRLRSEHPQPSVLLGRQRRPARPVNRRSGRSIRRSASAAPPTG